MKMTVAGILSVSVLALFGTAQACTLDNVPSVSLNGHLATFNKTVAQTSAQLRVWAPFVFRVRPASGKRLTFNENRKEVAKSLTKQAMAHPALWRFGDGSSSRGWRVSHVYKRSATYRITVLAYDRTTGKWYPFDQVTLHVRKR